MPNVFICHRKADTEAAERLAQEIRNAGHNVWFDEWNISIGDSIVNRIDEGLGSTTYLVLCYSSSGMSDWVNREWHSALARQLNGHGVKILPVLLTGGAPPPILADIKYANLLDSWDRGIAELLRAIR